MKLSVSAYRAHASAHKKILDTAHNLNYGSTYASHPHPAGSCASGAPTCSGFQGKLTQVFGGLLSNLPQFKPLM
ncbi:unnamed protein product [Brassicogethes aeneus]|uniref:Uncharacterized protein n=1 Tax=Brassicogethes aeneus TaxID=1431903 RepID=A0A9P0AVL9_BRAAE|nr:unnamed protein product [Brassicogethes aeneus]